MEQDKTKLISAIIFAVVIVVGVIIGSNAIIHRNDRPKVISVKGGAERNFVSDLVVWKVSIVNHSDTPLEGLRSIDRQRVDLLSFLIEKGVPEDDIEFGPVSYSEDIDEYYDENRRRFVKVKKGFNVSQEATVSSSDVDLIEKVSRTVGELIERDVTAQPSDPKYYYTKLADLKLEMVAAAAADAKERALQIAEQSGADLGDLRSSRLGVFQIVGKYSDEDYSWGGNFNTRSKEKTVSITVTSDFLLK